MGAIKSLNLGLRFMLEVAALGAAGYWGFSLDRSTLTRWIFGLVVPLMVVVVWAIVIAPGSDNGLSPSTKMWVGTIVLTACAGALAAAERPVLALLMAGAIVTNATLMQIWHQ